MRYLYTAYLLLTTVVAALSQELDDKKSYNTTRITGETPKIDGLLNDSAWDNVEWGGGDFTQRQPNEGAAPTVQTKFKILYDDKNLYIAIKNFDPEPEKIVKRMTRRDGFEGDRVAVMFDSYYDQRTAFSFTAASSGVKGEEYVSNNGDNWDAKWDPIWYLATSIESDGWVAEMRIPLSQLRFADKENHTWGLQISRYFFRNDEWSLWQHIPLNAPGWVHLFGELNGINGIKPQKQLEIQPYVVASTERFEEEVGNPYKTGKASDITFGVDAKVGITSDITLDLTISPDFGQVEADPSQVNLTAFQLFFPEQRPFFIEGNNILTFPINSNNDNLFYSRRIGRRPHVDIDTDNDDFDGDGENDDDNVDEYVKRNNNTRILGSAKLTGKNKNGFSWGILESVTRKEEAEIDSLGIIRNEMIEPTTNYLVGRVQQDLNQGQTVFGGMVTAVNRDDVDDTDIASSAYSAGVDLTHYFKQRKFFVKSNFLGSNVNGNTNAITKLQKSPVRYYQRTDNEYKNVDESATSLSGTGGSLVLGKRTGNIVYDLGGSWNSPGFESNDIGFLQQTDKISQWAWVQYRKLTSFSKFRSLRVNFNQRQEWDFGSNPTLRTMDFSANLTMKNFWEIGTGGTAVLYRRLNADLRGGPSLLYPKSYDYYIWVGTDNRKKVRFELNPWLVWSENNYRNMWGLWSKLTIRPTNALNINFTGSLSRNMSEIQYVTTVDNNGEDRYLIGKIDQMVYNLSVRATYVITPNLSIQYWGQPFAASARFSNLKSIANSTAEDYQDRFIPLNSYLNSETGDVDIDENNDNVVDYSISNPDFNFSQFQSNMVLRWEYIPGSTLFLVWNQSRSDEPTLDRQSYDELYSSLFDRKPHNIFLIKYTYRFLL